MKHTTKIFTTLLAIPVIALFSVTANAQSFEKGTSVINAGIGFGYSIAYYTAGGSATPVIGASYEYGVTELGPGVLGLGAAFSYQGASWTYSDGAGDTWNDKWTTTLFGIRGTYHPDFCNGDKYDVYGVLQISYVHFGFSETSSGPFVNNTSYGAGLNSTVYPYLLIGGRYYFTSSIGIFGELGYDLSYLKVGLCVKFGGEGGSGKK